MSVSRSGKKCRDHLCTNHVIWGEMHCRAHLLENLQLILPNILKAKIVVAVFEQRVFSTTGAAISFCLLACFPAERLQERSTMGKKKKKNRRVSRTKGTT